MSINLKNSDAERLLNELAEETGTGLTQAAIDAFRERLERLRRERAAARSRTLNSLLDLVAEARAAKPPEVSDTRPLKQLRDELWGDDE